MLQSNQSATTACESSCESVTVPTLISVAAALVGALTVYLAFLDSGLL
jgi:hypothetical protein